ncbi:MAG: 16S rRNA (guanine(966)-N(2))-methyltransferase RsmD [Candidatus Desulfaltia sp.]|nr:16S rRNA (guanine(966)-N(2))-methyltransferase RsmD [Candidatus Desulfaltia sp.]
MRIIGGNLKAKKLYSAEGMVIRPTSDRLRESIFDILSFKVRHAVVLDMFAGTGAMGIEALSRGAESALFIDIHNKALSIIERNIKACGLENKAKIIKWDIIKNLNCTNSYQAAFNLVFIDPPYNKSFLQPTLHNLIKAGPMEKGACLVVEHSLLEPIPLDFPEYELQDQRKYGKSLVSFLTYIV